jgi:type I restriction enzyme S subunit
MKRVEIGSLCVDTRFRDPGQSPGDTFRYIDISSVNKDRKEIASTLETYGADAPSRARKEVEAGDIIVSTVRPNLNAVAMVPTELHGQIASTGFCVLRANREDLEPGYLFYWVQTPRFVNELVSQMRGANYPAVSDGVVKSARIPYVPPAEQRRIVEILDQADALRKLRREADALAERILPALFYKMFGDPVRNSKNLPEKNLGDLIKVKSGESVAVKNLHPSVGYPVYGGNGINGYHTEYMFEDPVIVIGRVGVYCGAVYYSEPKSWATDNALYVSEKSDELLDRYLVEALRMANLNQYAGRAGQPLISGSRIYPVEILVPRPDDQKEFGRLVEHLDGQMSNRTEAADQLDKLFAVLLHRAFTGELTEKWRERQKLEARQFH